MKNLEKNLERTRKEPVKNLERTCKRVNRFLHKVSFLQVCSFINFINSFWWIIFAISAWVHSSFASCFYFCVFHYVRLPLCQAPTMSGSHYVRLPYRRPFGGVSGSLKTMCFVVIRAVLATAKSSIGYR